MGLAHTSLFVINHHGNMTITDTEICTGKVFYVDSTAATAGDNAHHGQSKDQPFATLAYAATQAVDLRGDWIVLGPNHAETVAAAGGIVFGTLATPVRCVTVFGARGHGREMPTITFDGAGADTTIDINIDSDGIMFKNIHFVNTEDGALGPLDVNGVNCTFDGCIFEDAGADNTIVWILNVAAGLTVKNCINLGTATAGNTAWISTGAAAHIRIENCQSHGDFSAGNIVATAAVSDIVIRKCWLETYNAAGVNFQGFAASTGFMADCRCIANQDADVVWANTNGVIGLFENYGVNNIAGSTGEAGRIVGVRSI